MSGGQINVITKSGGNSLRGTRLRVPSQRRARREELFRRRRQARLHAQSVRRHRGRAGSREQAVLFRRLRGPARKSRAHDHVVGARRKCPARPAAGSGQPRPVSQCWRQCRGRAVHRRVSRCPTARTSATARRYTASSSISASTRTTSRARIDANLSPDHAVLHALHARRCGSASAAGLPAVPARVQVAQSVCDRRAEADLHVESARHVSLWLQPHARRPGRRGQHAAGAVRARDVRSSATSMSAACSVSVRRAPRTCD